MHNHENKDHEEVSRLSTAFFLNLIFSFIELIGGYLVNSVSILSDALHDFTDSVSLAIAWGLHKYSNKESDSIYTYGYKRFSLLSSIIISIFVLISSFFVIKESVFRIINPEPSNTVGMFLLSILGIVVNGIAVLKLKKGSSFNERAIMLHMLEDTLGWCAILIASIVMYFFDIPILDPILSIVIALWMIYNLFKNIRETSRVLFQRTPHNVDKSGLELKIGHIKGVLSIHDVHIWSLDGEKNILTLHLVMDKYYNLKELSAIKNEIRMISNQYNLEHVTIEFESSDEDCFLTHCTK
ncbi:MAG: cation diffusion facilitator family transporter [Bacteroidales bacterium]